MERMPAAVASSLTIESSSGSGNEHLVMVVDHNKPFVPDTPPSPPSSPSSPAVVKFLSFVDDFWNGNGRDSDVSSASMSEDLRLSDMFRCSLFLITLSSPLCLIYNASYADNTKYFALGQILHPICQSAMFILFMGNLKSKIYGRWTAAYLILYSVTYNVAGYVGMAHTNPVLAEEVRNGGGGLATNLR
jgi:hypothetical protein